MGQKKVLIPTRLDAIGAELLRAHGRYTVVQDDATPLPDLAAAHPDAYAMIVRSESVTEEILSALPSLKVVIRAGAGFNTIDTRAARKRGVDVMNTPGANANGVAEEAIAMMLADARHIVAADISCRAGGWEKKKFMGRELAGRTVGIVGLGAIGKLVARRLSGFDCRLLGYDPFLSNDRAEELDLHMTDLPTLFAESDVVTLHLPENNDTRGLVNAALLARMKPGATLVNCARAGIVNEDDLRAAKAERKLRFLNDVYPKDEPGPKSVADVADLMLPHLGANTVEAGLTAARRAAEQLIDFDDKGITSYVVNRDIPEGLDRAYAELAFMLARLCRAVAGRGHALKLIETSFYGDLRPFAPWLVVPLVAGLDENFDRSADAGAARRRLKSRGIEYQDRETDGRKGYKNSITMDLVVEREGGTLQRASVRGTVTEGTLMVSRIDDFDKLFFEPRGHIAGFVYRDRPGVIGAIGAAFAEAGINIHDMRNPHDPTGARSIAVLKVNGAVSPELMQAVSARIEALRSFTVEL
jgi:D-3-phosphoglycerate dehydrogenase / 2-oxoglutarate reductase